jgi:hypothetical protein
MDIRQYYERQRQVYERLPEGFVVIISEATPDGGRAGLRSEVDRKLAAKLIVEGRAREANKEESAAFRREVNGRRLPKR